MDITISDTEYIQLCLYDSYGGDRTVWRSPFSTTVPAPSVVRISIP